LKKKKKKHSGGPSVVQAKKGKKKDRLQFFVEREKKKGERFFANRGRGKGREKAPPRGRARKGGKKRKILRGRGGEENGIAPSRGKERKRGGKKKELFAAADLKERRWSGKGGKGGNFSFNLRMAPRKKKGVIIETNIKDQAKGRGERFTTSRGKGKRERGNYFVS